MPIDDEARKALDELRGGKDYRWTSVADYVSQGRIPAAAALDAIVICMQLKIGACDTLMNADRKSQALIAEKAKYEAVIAAINDKNRREVTYLEKTVQKP